MLGTYKHSIVMNIPKWTWVICLLLVPLIMIDGLIDAVTIPRTLLLLVGSASGGVLLFQEKKEFHKHSRDFLSSLLGMSLMAYLLIGFFSLSQASSLPDAILEWLKIICWFNVILWSSFLLKKKKNSLLFMKATVFVVFVVSVIGLVEFFSIMDRLEERKILYTINSTFEHKNLFATGLLLSLPFSFLLYRQVVEKYWKVFAIVTAILAVGLILATQSRAAWLGLGGSIFLLFGIVLLNGSIRKKALQPKYLVMVGGSLIVGLGFVWSLSSQGSVQNTPIKRIQAVFIYEDTKNEHTETINERLFLWSNTVEMIKEHPLLGVGLGNWKIHFPKYKMDGLRSEQGEIFFQRPHNDYLWVMSEMGVFGGIAYMMIFGSLLFYIFRLLREKKLQESSDYLEVLILTCGLFAFMIFSFVDFSKERPVHLLWSGLLIAYIWNHYQRLKGSKNGSLTQVVFVPYILTAVSIIGFFFVAKRWQSEMHCKNALVARNQQQYNTVLSEIELANNWTYRIDPASTPLIWYEGEAFYLMGQLPAALNSFLKAEELHPHHLHTLNNLGATYFGLNKLPEAKKYFEKVLGIAPHFPDANMNLGAIAYNEGRAAEAINYIGTCVPMEYQDTRFLQFLSAICKSYAEELAKHPRLEKLKNVIGELASSQEWQITIHEQAQQYNRSFAEQIHLDLLFLANQQGVIYNEEEENVLTSVLNNYLIPK
jgi:O-antigen ligase/Tfp pilus assembly protein PilF